MNSPWPQPLDPLHSVALSALAASLPLVVVLILMGALRKSGLFASLCGFLSAILLALFLWRMPASLVLWSAIYGVVYALWPILWIVFTALWLYNLTQDTGKFELLRRWMEQHATRDSSIQAVLVAFCFGALLEGTAGFGAPVAVTACLLVGLGHPARRAVLVALIANTAPVAFGALGIPTIALAGVTGLDLAKLSAMTGRQVPFLSLLLPAYLICVVSGIQGLRKNWPVALISGLSFALTQFLVSNFWGPYITDVLAASISILVTVTFLKIRPPIELGPNSPARVLEPVPSETPFPPLTQGESIAAWLPWVMLSVVVILWSWFKLLPLAQSILPVPSLHNAVLITLYQKPYAALYTFQPLGPGTAVLAATILTALCLRVPGKVFLISGAKTFRQLRIPAMTVMAIVGLAYLYNYSGMAYTLGATFARVGPAFPLLSGFLGWIACFLTGSDTASNLLFGNLQVAAAHQLHLNPILLAVTNSSGAVAGKMVSPQNIAVGVITVGLIGQEGKILRSAFWHSILLAAVISLIAFAQAYWFPWMIP
ncbi:L-lactate permease [Acidicapsa acidisoli]|uniref:L-lactate permease n=1 Tax=Acidicapsa acidisoli TaxID=1615681 RepID=UPI0021E08DAF|nr:L-lactate permease [Acidicapsa acidisoli]